GAGQQAAEAESAVTAAGAAGIAGVAEGGGAGGIGGGGTERPGGPGDRCDRSEVLVEERRDVHLAVPAEQAAQPRGGGQGGAGGALRQGAVELRPGGSRHQVAVGEQVVHLERRLARDDGVVGAAAVVLLPQRQDRKSTRLNSS